MRIIGVSSASINPRSELFDSLFQRTLVFGASVFPDRFFSQSNHQQLLWRWCSCLHLQLKGREVRDRTRIKIPPIQGTELNREPQTVSHKINVPLDGFSRHLHAFGQRGTIRKPAALEGVMDDVYPLDEWTAVKPFQIVTDLPNRSCIAVESSSHR